MTRSIDLYELQEIDSAMDAADRRLDEIASALEDESGLAALAEQARELEAAIGTAQSEQRQAMGDVEDQRQKIAEVEATLYGGSVKIPRELKALEAEAAGLKKQLATLEERALTAMTRVEEAESARNESREALASQSEERERLVAALAEERSEIEARRATLRGERERRAEGIDRTDLALYERLRRARGGRAVAKVERGTCQGCRITLPSTVFQRARSGLKLVQCTSCERILYVA
jgi:uncharacterized protein